MTPRRSVASKAIRGTLKAARERERQAQKPVAAVTPEKIREMRAPAGLTETQRKLYRRTVRSAPWLTPADIPALVLWTKAMDLVMAAEDLREVTRQAGMASALGRQLGLTPAGRRALGLDDSEPPPAATPGDPWNELRVVRGGQR